MDSGYSRYFTLTKSDTIDFDGGASTRNASEVSSAPGCLCDAIYGVAGDIIAVLADGSTVKFTISTATQQLIPIKARRVNSTNTTATAMVALYR